MSRTRYYSQGLKERLGDFVAYQDLVLTCHAWAAGIR